MHFVGMSVENTEGDVAAPKDVTALLTPPLEDNTTHPSNGRLAPQSPTQFSPSSPPSSPPSDPPLLSDPDGGEEDLTEPGPHEEIISEPSSSSLVKKSSNPTMDRYLDPTRPYKCTICSESFTQKTILLVHYNSVSHLHRARRALQDSGTGVAAPEAPRGQDSRPYRCRLCGVGYSQSSTLDIHLRSVLHQTRARAAQNSAPQTPASSVAAPGSVHNTAIQAATTREETSKNYSFTKRPDVVSSSTSSLLGLAAEAQPTLSNPTDSQHTKKRVAELLASRNQLMLIQQQHLAQAQAQAQAQLQQHTALLQSQLIQHLPLGLENLHFPLTTDNLLSLQQQLLLPFYLSGDMQFNPELAVKIPELSQFVSANTFPKEQVKAEAKSESQPLIDEKQTQRQSSNSAVSQPKDHMKCEAKVEAGCSGSSIIQTEREQSNSSLEEEKEEMLVSIVKNENQKEETPSSSFNLLGLQCPPPRVPYAAVNGEPLRALLQNYGYELALQYIQSCKKDNKEKCSDCGKFFSDALILKSHQEYIHRMLFPTATLERFSREYRLQYDQMYPITHPALLAQQPQLSPALQGQPPQLSTVLVGQPSQHSPIQTGQQPQVKPHRGRRSSRTRFTEQQLETLQTMFEATPYPREEEYDRLSAMLSLPNRVIVVWFQNARQRARKSQDRGTDDELDGKNQLDNIHKQRNSCYKNDDDHEDNSCGDEGQGESQNENSMDLTYEYYTNPDSPVLDSSTHCTESEHPTAKGEPTPVTRKQEDKAVSPAASKSPALCSLCPVSFIQIKNTLSDHSNNSLTSLTQSSLTPLKQNSKLMPETSFEGQRSSREVDEEHRRDKRQRTTITPEQLEVLYQRYSLDSNPTRGVLESIARDVGLTRRVVQVWFQNTRARERKGQFRSMGPGSSFSLGFNHLRCPFCRALFKVKSALDAHMRSRHWAEAERAGYNLSMNNGSNGQIGMAMSSVMDRPGPSVSSNLIPNHGYVISNKELTVKPPDYPCEEGSSMADQASPSPEGSGGPSSDWGETQTLQHHHHQQQRQRTQMSHFQVLQLRDFYRSHRTPNRHECEALGQELGLPHRVVQVWFQNARAKEKRARSLSSDSAEREQAELSAGAGERDRA
uniref:Zinc finger homeobox protein 3 n=1 Tax=Dicentrarchus labrax TaxID=13489 RepID=A0A8C4IEP3_DICLA